MADWLEGDPPVFVFGALRSGTTVFRLMLDAHGEIRNPGEADYLVDYRNPTPAIPPATATGSRRSATTGCSAPPRSTSRRGATGSTC